MVVLWESIKIPDKNTITFSDSKDNEYSFKREHGLYKLRKNNYIIVVGDIDDSPVNNWKNFVNWCKEYNITIYC